MFSSQLVPSGQSVGDIVGIHSTNEQSGHKGKMVLSEQKLKAHFYLKVKTIYTKYVELAILLASC